MVTDLIVPLKPPDAGKSRLRGAPGVPVGAPAHAELVLALAADTLCAALGAAQVRRVLVVGSDPDALSALRELGAEVLDEDVPTGLNAALRAGERRLRADDPAGVLGALQADLPALRTGELATALTEANQRRAFAADRHGTGTTLLLSAPGQPLDPRFGPGSAPAHAASGAWALEPPLPSLRGDVDTPSDLEHARLLGVGEHTRALVERHCLPG